MTKSLEEQHSCLFFESTEQLHLFSFHILLFYSHEVTKKDHINKKEKVKVV